MQGKRKPSAEQVEWSTETIRAMVRPDTDVYTLTTYGRGETDYVRVFVVNERGRIYELTYALAQTTSYTRRDNGLALGGGNYSKGLDVFEALCRVAGIGADQSKWSEL